MRLTLILCTLLLLCLAPVSAQEQTPDVDVEVMVLGTYHFAGSTSDLINVETDNVLSERRQAELHDLAEALAAFEPTVIVTERVTGAPDYIDPNYIEFDDEMLATVPNERVQVGYRLARMIGTDRVYGLDEQPAEGEPDYFPFGKLMEHASETGKAVEIQAYLGSLEQRVIAETERLMSLTMRQSLLEVNTGDLSSPEFYYALLKYDEGENQPAAELNAYWMMRNAKIFSKLEDVTQPGDRVVVVYGAGHKFWLDHFVENTPGFAVVDPAEYLAE